MPRLEERENSVFGGFCTSFWAAAERKSKEDFFLLFLAKRGEEKFEKTWKKRRANKPMCGTEEHFEGGSKLSGFFNLPHHLTAGGGKDH